MTLETLEYREKTFKDFFDACQLFHYDLSPEHIQFDVGNDGIILTNLVENRGFFNRVLDLPYDGIMIRGKDVSIIFDEEHTKMFKDCLKDRIHENIKTYEKDINLKMKYIENIQKILKVLR